jgi:hypothetical protein
MREATLFKTAGSNSLGGTAEALFGFFSLTERKSEQELPKITRETNRINIFLFISNSF